MAGFPLPNPPFEPVGLSAATRASLASNGGSNGSGGGSSDVLARKTYAPADATVKSNPTNAFVALDPVNLTVAFTAPAAGAVQVTLDAMVNGVGSWTSMALLDHSSHATVSNVYSWPAPDARPIHLSWIITGLAVGQTYQYDLAAANAANTTGESGVIAQGSTTPTGAAGAPATLIVRTAG